jgi:hypothetical protein
MTQSNFVVLGVCLAATAVLNCGCIIVPYIDRPSDIAPSMPSDFASGDADTLVLVVRSRDNLFMDEPIFTKVGDITAIEEKLEKTSLAGFVIAPGGPSAAGRKAITPILVHELCLIAANGKTISLLRQGEKWKSSAVSVVDAVWRNQVARLLAENVPNRPVTLLRIWKSSPCTTQVDWAQMHVGWNNEQRTRVIQFLNKLPLE